YRFRIQGWVDHFGTWCADLKKRLAAQPDPAQPSESVGPQDIPLALRTGALLVEAAAERTGRNATDAAQLRSFVASLLWMADQNAERYEYPVTEEMEELVARYPALEFSPKSDY